MSFLKENWFKLMTRTSMLIFACGFFLKAVGASYSNYNSNIQSNNLNQIEPLVFPSTLYINQGDSLKSVFDRLGIVAPAYDSTESFAVVGLPEMRVLYRGYDNMVEVAAFGFDPDQVTVSGSGCNISKRGAQYVAIVGGGVRVATISVYGHRANGDSLDLGSFKFSVKSLPTPILYLGSISQGQSPGASSVRAQARVSCRYDDNVPLTNVKFSIVNGTVSVDGFTTQGKVLSGGILDETARQILALSQGKQVTITVRYRGTDGVSKITSLIFTTR